MCGRYVSATDAEGLVKMFVVDERQIDDVPASYNVAPTDVVPAIVSHGEKRHLVQFRWGLVPHWADSLRIGARMINARAETAADKPAFRPSLATKRCLIPADGFYEWERQGKMKLPWFVHREDRRPMAFAGLWAAWRDDVDPDASWIRTCAIMTTGADGSFADLHDRMPVEVDQPNWDRWLDRQIDDAAAVSDILQSPASVGWDRYRVSTAVNSVANNGPELLAPL